MRAVIRHLTRSSEGQDLIEYGVLIGIIAVALVVSLSGIGGRVSSMYTSLTVAIGADDPGAGNPGGGNPGGGNPGGGNPGGGNPGGGKK